MDNIINITEKNFDTILELLKNEDLKVKWSKQGFSIQITNEEFFDTLEEEEREPLIKSIFNLFKKVRQHLEGKEIDDEYIKYIDALIEKVDYIKDNFIIYRNSNAYILEDCDFEIITKRSKKKIEDVLGYSTLVSLKAFHATDIEKTKSLTFDISEHDLDNLIKVLSLAKENMNLLKN